MRVRVRNGHIHTENTTPLVIRMKSSEQVSEAMQFFNAYTRLMLGVALSMGVIQSILDNYPLADACRDWVLAASR